MCKRSLRSLLVGLAMALLGCWPATANEWDRLSDLVREKPEKALGRILSRGEGLFSDAWLGEGVAYFMGAPSEVAPGLCGQDGLAVVLGDDRKAERVVFVSRYLEIGARMDWLPEAQRRKSCGQSLSLSDYAWAPDTLTAVRALDLFRGAVKEASALGEPSFDIICGEGQPCPPERRAELAAMNELRVVNIQPAKCPPERECFEVEVWRGTNVAHDAWGVVLEADGRLRQVDLSRRWSFQAEDF